MTDHTEPPHPPLVQDLATLVVRLVRALRKADPSSELPHIALDFLRRHNLLRRPLDR